VPTPRSRPQRRRDTGHRLTHDIDVWVGPCGASHARSRFVGPHNEYLPACHADDAARRGATNCRTVCREVGRKRLRLCFRCIGARESTRCCGARTTRNAPRSRSIERVHLYRSLATPARPARRCDDASRYATKRTSTTTGRAVTTSASRARFHRRELRADAFDRGYCAGGTSVKFTL